MDIDNYKEFVIDLRTPEQLNACRLSKKTQTFKQQLDIWDERPVLIHDEECNYVKFKGQLDFSSSLNQIVRIKSYDEYVEFEFHEKSGAFKTNKILRFKRDHFN